MKIENLWKFVTRQALWMCLPMVALKMLGLTSVAWWITVGPVVVPVVILFVLAGLEWLLRFYSK